MHRLFGKVVRKLVLHANPTASMIPIVEVAVQKLLAECFVLSRCEGAILVTKSDYLKLHQQASSQVTDLQVKELSAPFVQWRGLPLKSVELRLRVRLPVIAEVSKDFFQFLKNPALSLHIHVAGIVSLFLPAMAKLLLRGPNFFVNQKEATIASVGVINEIRDTLGSLC